MLCISSTLCDTNVACVIGPSANTSRAQLIFPCKANFCNNKIHSKINIFHTLALKIVKQTCQMLSKNTKNASKF
jgi:hypothetical protein